MLTPEQTRAYLDRLDIDEVSAPTKENLDRLIYAHQTRIPFETVNLHRSGAAPDLSTEVIFDRLITKKLGGYCFELNKLFQELLETLGYDVRPVLCRAVRGRDGRMPINHRGIIVTLDDGQYSADVGFGGPMPAGALMLAPGKEQSICGETYIAERTDHAWWKIDRVTRAASDFFDDGLPSRRHTELELCSASVEDIDFDALNLSWVRPGTLFHDHEIVNLRTDDGFKGFKDGVLTVKRGADKTITECPDDATVDAVLLEHFGLDYRR